MMKKILFIMIALLLVGCATWTFDGSTTVAVKDKAGNTYSCVFDYATTAQKGSCKFFIQKGMVVYKCELSIEKQKNFTVEEDCTIEITLQPAEPKTDQACHFPKNQTKAFYNRTL